MFCAIKDDVINAGASFEDSEVVVDDNLVTSRKPEDLPAFCRAAMKRAGGIAGTDCLSSAGAAISVHGLRKSYGDFEAVRGIDFEVAPGEVFGLLGPNGAGKTTTVEILEGLRPRTAGDGFGSGLRSRRAGAGAEGPHRRVACKPPTCPTRCGCTRRWRCSPRFIAAASTAINCWTRLKLTEKKNAYYSKLSGGQKQRVALALALINDPQVLFLDEPTTGLDPQVRLEIHSLIEELKRGQAHDPDHHALHRRGREAVRPRGHRG